MKKLTPKSRIPDNWIQWAREHGACPEEFPRSGDFVSSLRSEQQHWVLVELWKERLLTREESLSWSRTQQGSRAELAAFLDIINQIDLIDVEV